MKELLTQSTLRYSLEGGPSFSYDATEKLPRQSNYILASLPSSLASSAATTASAASPRALSASLSEASMPSASGAQAKNREAPVDMKRTICVGVTSPCRAG
jgi:hypothetical protein